MPHSNTPPVHEPGAVLHLTGNVIWKRRVLAVSAPQADFDVRAVLTEAVRHLIEAEFRADMASETQYLAALDARELETLSALLRKLNQSIEASLAPPNP